MEDKKEIFIITQDMEVGRSLREWMDKNYPYKEINIKEEEKILENLKKNDFKLIILNLKDMFKTLPQFISALKNIVDIPIIIIYQNGSLKIMEKISSEIYHFIERPFSQLFLFMTIRNAIEYKRLKNEIEFLFQELLKSNQKIEEGNRYLKEIEDKIEQLLTLRYL